MRGTLLLVDPFAASRRFELGKHFVDKAQVKVNGFESETAKPQVLWRQQVFVLIMTSLKEVAMCL
jgi:hypothetical protein